MVFTVTLINQPSFMPEAKDLVRMQVATNFGC